MCKDSSHFSFERRHMNNNLPYFHKRKKKINSSLFTSFMNKNGFPFLFVRKYVYLTIHFHLKATMNIPFLLVGKHINHEHTISHFDLKTKEKK